MHKWLIILFVYLTMLYKKTPTEVRIFVCGTALMNDNSYFEKFIMLEGNEKLHKSYSNTMLIYVYMKLNCRQLKLRGNLCLLKFKNTINYNTVQKKKNLKIPSKNTLF